MTSPYLIVAWKRSRATLDARKSLVACGSAFAKSTLYHNGIVTRRTFLILASTPVWAQVIEFESGGLKYQTLSKNSVTVMFAHLPSHVLDYSILQVAVSNGAKTPYTVRPEDFTFERSSGAQINAAPARSVVSALIDKG